MDIEDLFDFNDEDFIVSCGQTEIENTFKSVTNVESVIRHLYFECSGEDSMNCLNNIRLSDLNHVIEVFFKENGNFTTPSSFELFNFSFEVDFLDSVGNLEHLLNMTRTNIQKLQWTSFEATEQNDLPSFKIRESVTIFLQILRTYHQHLTNDHLRTIRLALGTLDSIQSFPLFHQAYSAQGNQCTTPLYHLLHGELEWRWTYLTIIYSIEKSKNLLNCPESEFKCELKLLMYDLLTLSITKFNKKPSNTPFICHCVKELWFLIHRMLNWLQEESLDFWLILGSILKNIQDGKNPYSEYPTKLVLLRSSINITCKNVQFSIWMFSGLFKFFNSIVIDNITLKEENFDLLENLLRSYLKTELSEVNLRATLIMVVDIITEWSPKSDIITMLWDYFHKMINSAFLNPNQELQFMAVSSKSAVGYLEQIRAQQSTFSKLNPNHNSYSMFVYLVGRIVQKFSAEGQKIQIQKFLGRIYTKFPASKLQALNEMGIHNLMCLLLTLAVSTNFQDIGQKIADTLLQIPLDNAVLNQQQTIVKGHMTLMILFRENQMNLTQYTFKFLNQINDLLREKSNNSFVSVLKIIGEAMPMIISKNSGESFDVGNDLLIDTWIIHYLNSCTLAEQDRMFESITHIIQRTQLNEFNSFDKVDDNLKDFILKLFIIFLPYTKQSFSKSESIWLPELVGNLCLLAYKFERIEGVPKFENLFREFIDMECSNIGNSIKFASVVVDNTGNINQIDKTALLQHWIKCSVLLSGSNKELKALTKSIMSLKEFTELCDSAVSNPDEFINSKEPFCLFIADIGKKYSKSKDQQRLQLLEKFHKYFGKFDKWALSIVQQQQQSSSQAASKALPSGSDEAVMRIYTFIAITFLHCSELIYVRSRSSCFFNIAISNFILPGSIMMGLSQPRSTVIAMFKVWHVLIEGITKLDYVNDQHVSKVFTDLIVKWTPLLKISSVPKVVAKPFINLMNLKKIEVVECVWAKLGKAYITLNHRKSSQHACLVLTILEELMNVIVNDENKMLIVWRSFMVFMIEAAIMSEDNVPSQVICYNLLEKYLKNPNFQFSQDMQQLFLVNVKNYTQKQLSYYSTFYFKFMFKIAKMNQKIVADLLPFLQSQIKIVEQQRGMGNDLKLRSSYDSLKISVQNK